MTSPIATALTGLLGGYNAGMEQRRARERQAMLDKRQADLDAQNRSDKDRDFRLRYSEGSLKRAVDTMNAGLIPDNGQLDTADFTGVKSQPGLDAMSGLPDTSQLFQAVSNMRAAPRIGIADESGQTTQYRQGEPVWQKRIRMQATAKEEQDAAKIAAQHSANDVTRREQVAARTARVRQLDPSKADQADAIANDDKLYDSWASSLLMPKSDATLQETIRHNKAMEGLAGQRLTAQAGKSGANAPLMTKEGQFGEMLRKAPDLFKAAEALDVTLSNSAAKDIAEHGLGIGGLRIPGTKGIGSMMLNQHPTYAAYQAALAPYVLANAHAMSGARINQEQANMIQRSIERQPGDLGNPAVLAQRDKNVIDQLNAIAASLPPESVAAQESEIDPVILDELRKRGYRGVPASRGPGAGGRSGGGGGGSSHPLMDKYGLTPRRP